MYLTTSMDDLCLKARTMVEGDTHARPRYSSKPSLIDKSSNPTNYTSAENLCCACRQPHATIAFQYSFQTTLNFFLSPFNLIASPTTIFLLYSSHTIDRTV